MDSSIDDNFSLEEVNIMNIINYWKTAFFLFGN